MSTTTLPTRPRASPPQSPTTTTTTSDDEDDYTTLPYPQPLSRSDFLSPDFNPTIYLQTLHNRHQTLEDLRTELRQRSTQITRELLDLVNNEYEDFVSLGADLKGGGERVEGVRVGCLGFGREVEGLRDLVGERAGEVGGLAEERRGVLGEVQLGRGLLEVEERVGEMEEELGIGGVGRAEGEEVLDDSEEDEEEGLEGESGALRGLGRQAERLLLITRLIERLGPEHPFLQSVKPRVEQLRKTLLLNLASALRSAKTAGASGVIMGLLKLYADLGAEKESVRVLKGGG
ncbi:hypothetical protein MBLNU230_g0637t1 [Neophaeotheca triangularis]